MRQPHGEDLEALRCSFPAIPYSACFATSPPYPVLIMHHILGAAIEKPWIPGQGTSAPEFEVQMESSSVTPAGPTICLLPTSVPPGWPSLEVLSCIEGCLVLPEMEDLSLAFLPGCFNLHDVFLSLTPTCSHGNGWTKDTAWPEVRQLG